VLKQYAEYEYDDDNRLNLTHYADSATELRDYDPNGNLTLLKDGNDNETAYTHYAHDRMKTLNRPGDAVTQYAYDSHDNLQTVTDAENNTTEFTHNDFGNRLTRISADTDGYSYAYDTAGNLTSRTDANLINVSYTYDTLNRLNEMIFPDSAQNIVYSYDDGINGKGRLTGVSHLSGDDTFGYDALGNTVTVTDTTDNATYNVSYDYTPSGLLATMGYPSGLTLSFQTDDNGHITGVTDGDQTVASDITYLPFGAAKSAVFGDTLFTVTRDHNQRYQLKRITVDLTATPESPAASASTLNETALSDTPFTENPAADTAMHIMNEAASTTPADILSGPKLTPPHFHVSQKNPSAWNPFKASGKSSGQKFTEKFDKPKKYTLPDSSVSIADPLGAPRCPCF